MTGAIARPGRSGSGVPLVRLHWRPPGRLRLVIVLRLSRVVAVTNRRECWRLSLVILWVVRRLTRHW